MSDSKNLKVLIIMKWRFPSIEENTLKLIDSYLKKYGPHRDVTLIVRELDLDEDDTIDDLCKQSDDIAKLNDIIRENGNDTFPIKNWLNLKDLFVLYIINYYERLVSDETYFNQESRRESVYRNDNINRLGLKKDKSRFFSMVESEADILLWHNKPIWTIEEAIALSFGKDPISVNVSSLKKFSDTDSVFARNFRYRLDLADRAVKAGKILKDLAPQDFVDWLRSNNIAYDKALDISNYASVNADDSESNQIESLKNEVSRLREDNARLLLLLNEPDLPSKSIASLYKILIIMAVGKFRYVSGNSECGSQIEKLSRSISIAYEIDLNITHDTIKKWLDIACGYFNLSVDKPFR